MADMTNYSEEVRKDGPSGSEDTPRRRATDLPPPLDFPTRELVKTIVDSKPAGEAPRKSFIRKLLDRGAQ